MTGGNPIVNLITQGARARGLDPAAVLAVASVEGLGGGVGDQGTSFGPFQLHLGGAMPRGIRNPQQWATSQAGINYALDQIAGVARGQRGRQAISSIVSRFERPSDIPGEIQRASSRYGGPFAAGAVAPGARPPQPGRGAGSAMMRPGINPALLSVLNQGNEMFGLGALPAVTPVQVPKLRAPRQTPLAGNVTAGPQQTFKRGRTIRWIEHLASPFGLTVTSTTGGKHARGSYHYKGRAVDFGGNPNSMAQLARFALQHAGQFAEMFYAGPGNPGYFIKNGRVLPNSQLDPKLASAHQNHVHLAR